MELYRAFKHIVTRYSQPDSHLVLALSGGIDSRVLLDLMQRYQQESNRICRAVHIHHGLSANADLWQKQCQRWCEQFNIEFICERVTLDLSGGASIEQLARDARYQALYRHVHQQDILLTGQHSDDQLETFLLALKRGSGPKGLAAMAQVAELSRGLLIRPLLHFSRQQIETYAHEHNLDWVEDESNADTRFDRNFLRHNIIPQLSARWPSIRAAVQRSASLCAEQELLIDELLTPILASALNHDSSLSIDILQQHNDATRASLLRMWLSRLGKTMPSRKHLAQIWAEVAMARSDANPKLKLSAGEVHRYQQRLYFVDSVQDVSLWSGSLTLSQPLALPDGLGQLSLSADTTNATLALPNDWDSLQVIFEPKGLWAHPNERGHSRKLQKLFQEYQIPSWLRRRMPIVLYQDKVVAVGDLFVDRQFSGHQYQLQWQKFTD